MKKSVILLLCAMLLSLLMACGRETGSQPSTDSDIPVIPQDILASGDEEALREYLEKLN